MFKKLAMTTLGAAALLAAIPAAASADQLYRHTQFDGYAERAPQEYTPQQYAAPVYQTPGYAQGPEREWRQGERRSNESRQQELRENEWRENGRGAQDPEHDRSDRYNSRRDNDDRRGR